MKIPFFSSKESIDKSTVLGIDIGGTGIKGALVRVHDGELLTERIRLETPQPATPDAIMVSLNELIATLEWKGKIGCGFPAVIQNGVAKTASNIDQAWIGTDVQKLIKERTGLDNIVVNDADAAGLAEIRFGAGKDVKGCVLMITIGTGIGSAYFIDGKLIPNTEFGHLYYKDFVAEKYCSDSARKKYALEWDEWSKRFNNYLKHLERTINPDLFILGGGISKKQEKFMPLISLDTEIKIAFMENNAGIIGAAMAGAE